MALRVLRKLKRETINELHNPPEGIDWLYSDRNKEWFAKGYVDADTPRSGEINLTIMDGTTGFVVWADGDGEVQKFDTYDAADFARRNSKISLAVQIEAPEVEDEPPVQKLGKTKAADVAGLGAAAS